MNNSFSQPLTSPPSSATHTLSRLQVRDMKTLSSSLSAYFADEELEGVECETCKCRPAQFGEGHACIADLMTDDLLNK